MDTIHLAGEQPQISGYQGKYTSLVAVCQRHGTLIMQDRLLEKDQDTPPYKFFRKGTMEFIFPQQKVSLAEDTSRVIDPSTGYGLRTEEQTFQFDTSAVQGKIRIEYKDAGDRPDLKVVDALGQNKSELPDEVRTHLDQLVAELSAK